jgi:glycosyltransferase involved in cell wall biosynthesis
MSESRTVPLKSGLVAVATRDSQKFLESECYLSIVSQMQERALADPYQHLLVVDNSGVTAHPQTNNQKQVNQTVIYEPQAGIPFARNAALSFAQANDFDWIAFLDDDVLPANSWLREMIYALTQGDLDAIQGSWVFSYGENYPKYLPRMAASNWVGNENLRTASTINVIFKTQKVFKSGTRFNTALVELGGSDTEFFMALNNSGFKIGSTSGGLVYESIIGDRATLKWHLRRKIRTDQTWFHAVEKFGALPEENSNQNSNLLLNLRRVWRKLFSPTSLSVTNKHGHVMILPQLALLPVTALSFILLKMGIRVREYKSPKATSVVSVGQTQ